ncbi:hypothetical protein JCM8547_003807 [Rhodosporidiobolus lusitaniae]
MKLLPLVSSLALFSSLSLATAIPRDLHDNPTALDLDKRNPEPAPEPAPLQVVKEAGGVLEERSGQGSSDDAEALEKRQQGFGRQGRPSQDFDPSDDGRGYEVDYQGHGRPRGIPRSWYWYGREIGWAPYPGWRPPPRWEPPFVFIRVWLKVRWWSPPDYWRRYWYSRWHDDWYRYGVPTHWGWRPKDPSRRGRWYRRNGGWYWRRFERDD